MLMLIKPYSVKPDKEALFLKALNEYSKAAREKFNGCLMCVPTLDTEHPAVKLVIERWTDQKAYDAYLKSSFYKETLEKFSQLLEGKPQVHVLQELS